MRAESLTLNDAIRGALAHNPSLKVENYNRGISRANVTTAWGRFDPSINFRRTYSDNELPTSNTVAGLRPFITRYKEDDYRLSLDGVLPGGLSYSLGGQATNQRSTATGFIDDYVTFGGISVTQPLLRDFGLANLATLRIAKADRAISDWDYRQSVIDTVTRVVLAYNDLALAQENLKISKRSRALAQQTLDDNQKRLKAGYVSQSDVIEASARAAQREEAILLSERAVIDAVNAMRQLLGEDILNSGPLEIAPPEAAPFVTVNPADDLKIAFAQRPDYLAARLGVQKTRINASYERNQLLPRLDFIGSYGYNGADEKFSNSRRQVRDEDNAAWSAGLAVSIPLTFTEGRGRARAARLQKEQAEADLVRFEQDIAVVVANAAGQIDTTQKRVTATQRAYELGVQSLEGENKKLQAGTTSTFQVLQFQETLTSLESARARALADHRRALANYDRALGRTLERFAITLESYK
jgi:outer membrane protein TolC